jgi:hypothetical protein
MKEKKHFFGPYSFNLLFNLLLIVARLWITSSGGGWPHRDQPGTSIYEVCATLR